MKDRCVTCCGVTLMSALAGVSVHAVLATRMARCVRVGEEGGGGGLGVESKGEAGEPQTAAAGGGGMRESVC